MWHESLQAVTHNRHVITGRYLDRRQRPFTILYMDDVRSPARPWFDLVTQEIAVRGWGIAELARRAKVGRPTIYGWRDSPGKPQSGPVNAVADVLGIDRKRANELAGIIPRAGPEPEPELPPSLLADIYREFPDDEEGQRRAIRLFKRTLAEGFAVPPSADAPGQGQGRRAGL